MIKFFKLFLAVILLSTNAFAALMADGAVVAWGKDKEEAEALAFKTGSETH